MADDQVRTIPRERWSQCEPVEATDGLWHLRLDGRTLCELEADDWPVVLRSTELAGIWCGSCLHAIAT